jgi:UDP-glucuronate decarboxylase
MLLGATVVVLDDLSTGSEHNISHWLCNPKFMLIHGDTMLIDPDAVVAKHRPTHVFHLASPASPPHYQRDPVRTLMCNVQGTLNMLTLARSCSARFLLASTSEVYGDPEQHPQLESYNGSVNTFGPRACYDEGKRCAETLVYEHVRLYGMFTSTLRIFNTFGPRMQPDDGRVVSNFIVQAIRGEPLRVYGVGVQTRSFQFVHDLVDAMLIALVFREEPVDGPVNIGCPEERTIDDFASIVKGTLGRPDLGVVHEQAAIDDPQRRRPDITKARQLLGWQPKWSLDDGLAETVDYFLLRNASVKPKE